MNLNLIGIKRRNNQERKALSILTKNELIDEIITVGKKEYEDNPSSIYYRDGFTLLKRLERFKEGTLKFLKEPELPYTNNLSERLLRTIKMKYR